MCPAPAVDAVERFDAAAVQQRVFVGDRETKPRPFDAAFRRGLALLERFEDVRTVAGVDAGPVVDDVEHRPPVGDGQPEIDHGRAR